MKWIKLKLCRDFRSRPNRGPCQLALKVTQPYLDIKLGEAERFVFPLKLATDGIGAIRRQPSLEQRVQLVHPFAFQHDCQLEIFCINRPGEAALQS